MAENRQDAEKIMNAWHAGDTNFFIFTSGSTGEPKGFTLEKNKIEWSCNVLGDFLNVKPTDSIYCCLPVKKIGGWMQIARSLGWQVPIEIVEPTGDPLLGLKGNHSIISLTPMQLHNIMENQESREKLNRFRIVLVGGGEISKALENKTQSMRPDFYHTFGMTETYSQIAMRKLNVQSEFIPLLGTEIKINAEGCLCIKNFCTNNLWLETHDIVEQAHQGFVVLGRSDNVVNTGGIKVSAEKIETMLSNSLDLPEGSFFYAGISDDKFGQKPVLIVNKKVIGELPDWEHLFENDPFAKPKEVIYLSDFVYIETGKIKRSETLKKMEIPTL